MFWDGVRSVFSPRLLVLGVGASLLLVLNGVLVGDADTLRADGGGGGISVESRLLLKLSALLGDRSSAACLLGEANILVSVESCCKTFSFSSSILNCTGVCDPIVAVSSSCGVLSASSCLFGLERRLSTSATKGDDGGISNSIMLGSTSCAEGESIFDCLAERVCDSSLLCQMAIKGAMTLMLMSDEGWAEPLLPWRRT